MLLDRVEVNEVIEATYLKPQLINRKICYIESLNYNEINRTMLYLNYHIRYSTLEVS